MTAGGIAASTCETDRVAQRIASDQRRRHHGRVHLRQCRERHRAVGHPAPVGTPDDRALVLGKARSITKAQAETFGCTYVREGVPGRYL
jgi:hypothetical protein